MLYLTGADIIAAAALEAGCDFFAGYPITPSSSIMKNLLAWLPERGGVGIQAEDEISAASMCIAASMAGRRVITATSGPGMSLMSESIGLAQMAEVPMVIVDVQRMGPATGGATTNAEGDVQFARWITSGGYPLPVYAPVDLPSTWRLTLKAFDTAECLRTPVILLTSKNLVMTSETVDEIALVQVPVDARVRGTGRLPYAIDRPDAVPPFLPFGEELTRLTTSIHDERGIITESPAKAAEKLRHLHEKIARRREELAEITVHPAEAPRAAIVACGSPARAARVARRLLAKDGIRVTLVELETVCPLPDAALADAIATAPRIVVPELNPGLLAPEVARLAPGRELRSLTRLDGGLISPEEIAREVLR